MTYIDLPAIEPIRIAFTSGLWLCAGALIGTFHFATLRWNTLAFADAQSFLLPFGIQLIRFALTGTLLFGIARSSGALPLLMATVGILSARTAIIRRGTQS